MVSNKGSAKKSNLDRFLNCTTPVVQSQSLPKAGIRNLNRIWHPCEREKVEYFRLSDLWDSYDEWSAYGAGVPIRLTNGESLVQYYVPYLSAIQIFTSPSSLIRLREESESGYCETRDSISDYSCSEESDSDKQWRMDGSSASDEGLEQDAIFHPNDRLGYIYLQYFERSPPYARVPLMDKINELAERFPGLMSLRSVDLSPASWMAVAWYPIYHIPMGRTIKDLSTCFLTYHILSSSFQDMDSDDNTEEDTARKDADEISLVPFGMATYKMQGDVWVSEDDLGHDQERLVSLSSVADSWLKQLRVQHHDFNYFSGMSRRG
ncbi:PREDICTED: uncharacterized protein LOC104826029 [Tarenaya hassleriana]|uniref:uncharacterized protein LOC104826029 n=1 Tax=Tarenaya hassleriana TaxID=28532 RepID=UPI00053C0F5E|nr:PREDICTED: uncharacterized protein LOC104826029 [Tarenaya hassleriana]